MKDISSEIFVIYGLIGVVGTFIAFMIFCERKEKEKRVMNRTQELKLMDMRKTDDDYTEEFKKQDTMKESLLKDSHVLEKQNVVAAISTSDGRQKVRKIEEIKLETSTVEVSELSIDEALYVEDDLEKTSAQIQLELLAQELERAKEKEKMDQIQRFEFDQEESAIISYSELLKVCDDLYDQNEKVQYIDDGNEPINLRELKSRYQ